MIRQRGFTLLELLIAMTLVALLLTVLYGGLQLAIRGWEGGEARVERSNSVRLVEEFLRRQLAQTARVYVQDRQRLRRVAFSGDARSLTWVAPMLAYLGDGGLYMLRLEYDESSAEGVLRLRWWPYRPQGGEPPAEAVAEHVLLQRVDGARLRYFGSEDGQKAPQWYDGWTFPQSLPRLVRLDLSQDGEALPFLIVALAE
ncbi:MAG TPA: prepilin-type N-terminal cleavage/methylation domain-containing protein [Candidatus Competibacteraceae bacterium]|nr:prepilin-type N-terminal cleavage/methylation domain-containing protein [Candidatus Competibacteraceae bacterium]